MKKNYKSKKYIFNQHNLFCKHIDIGIKTRYYMAMHKENKIPNEQARRIAERNKRLAEDSRWLNEYIERTGVSLRRVSQRCGVQHSTLSKISNAFLGIPERHREAIAKAFEELFNEDQQKREAAQEAVEEVNKYIRLLVAAGWKKYQIGLELGKPPEYITGWCSGKLPIKPEQLKQLRGLAIRKA